jgi:hypothetical protein
VAATKGFIKQAEVLSSLYMHLILMLRDKTKEESDCLEKFTNIS